MDYIEHNFALVDIDNDILESAISGVTTPDSKIEFARH
jgi:hypothetical protein